MSITALVWNIILKMLDVLFSAEALGSPHRNSEIKTDVDIKCMWQDMPITMQIINLIKNARFARF